MDVLDQLMILHEAGLMHCDISEHNVVIREGRPFIIDLERARPHDCNRQMPVIQGDVNLAARKSSMSQ
jgi:RIO-like serine/threonine protein kinase